MNMRGGREAREGKYRAVTTNMNVGSSSSTEIERGHLDLDFPRRFNQKA